MKLHALYLVILLFSPYLAFSMGPRERQKYDAFKTQLKVQLKALKTSEEMEQLVKSHLSQGIEISLDLSSNNIIYFNITEDPRDNKGPFVVKAVEEAFFEEMYPFLFGGANKDVEAAKFSKYAWANEDVVLEVGNIFTQKLMQDKSTLLAGTKYVLSDAMVDRIRYLKNKVAEFTGENNLLTGKNDLMQRFEFFVEPPFSLGNTIAPYAVGGVVAATVGSGIYYYCKGQSDKKNNKAAKNHKAAQTNLKGDRETLL